MTDKLKLAVFISGGGTNLQALIDASQKPDYPARIVVVVSNVADAYGLTRAQNAGIPTEVVPHKQFKNRKAHETEILRRIERYEPQAALLAGYMRVVTPLLLYRFYDRARALPGVINIHPADTHQYQGAHGYEFALGLEPGKPQRLAETKITVHFVDAGVDTGAIIRQAKVEVLPGDTLEQLKERGLKVEHRVYPEVVRLYAEGRIRLVDKQVVVE
jgi:phosphoribosylglycinamide formyltransferase-1